MSRIILFNKPFDVLCQFTDEGGRATLADYIDAPGFYAAGRLDRDSEGLVILAADGRLQQRVANPRSGLWKIYWVQVEGRPPKDALTKLAKGVMLKDGLTLPAKVEIMNEPADLWPRNPPIRYRANIPTSWLRISIHEGRNRQVRRMTAAVGHPTLRLIRHAIGNVTLEGLAPGQWRFDEWRFEDARLMPDSA